jgi:hypothetical protein
MKSPLVHGQGNDYMKTLQSFHGLRRVFGIAATYHEWRVYWLEATDDLARADALDEPTKDVSEDEDGERPTDVGAEEPNYSVGREVQ